MRVSFCRSLLFSLLLRCLKAASSKASLREMSRLLSYVNTEKSRGFSPSFFCSLLFRPVLKFAKYDTLNYNTLNYKTHSYRVSYLGNLRTREREKDITHSLKDDAL